MSSKVGEIIFVANEELYSGKSEIILYNVDVNITDDNSTPYVSFKQPSSDDILGVLYTLINNEFLDNSDNAYNLSFLELLDYYYSASFEYLLVNFFDRLTKNDDFYIEKLNEIYFTIKNLQDGKIDEQDHFASYNLNELNITGEEYNQINVFIGVYYDLLNVIKQSIRIYQRYILFQNTNIKYTEAHNILTNDASLNSFLLTNLNSKQVNNLNVQTKLKISPKLNPYIKAYVVDHGGWPSDGVFDSEKMSKVIVVQQQFYNFLPPWNAFPPPI
tara:strand:+ start:621 stop:1439 length:819 start_codon:yes stop_codon:yes gene_type:complete